MPDPHPNQLLSLCNIDLDLAVDALLSDHLHRLTTLLQGFRRSQITEDDAVDVLEEALERRSFARRFEANLRLDEEDEDGRSATLPDVGGRVDGSVVSLLSSLELSEDQRKRHENWTPMEDERVLVWVSKERPAWPGKVMPLEYFSQDCLPDIPRNQTFAVNLYNLKPSPTVSIHSHMVPLSYISQPDNSDPALSVAYSRALSDDPPPDDTNRSTFGLNPTRLTVDGRPWSTHLNWLEEQVKQERPNVVEYEERKRWQRNARNVMLDLGKDLRIPTSTPHNSQQPSPPPATQPQPTTIPHSRSQIKRSRRKFQDLLDDSIVGPLISKIDTSVIQDALVVPRRGTPYIRTKSLPDENAVEMSGCGVTMRTWKEVDDFASPLGFRVSPKAQQEDEDMDGEGWHFVSKRKRRRTRCDNEDVILQPHHSNVRQHLDNIAEEA